MIDLEHQRPKKMLTEQLANRDWPIDTPSVIHELRHCTLFVVVSSKENDVEKVWIFTEHPAALTHKRSLAKSAKPKLFGVVPECELRFLSTLED